MLVAQTTWTRERSVISDKSFEDMFLLVSLLASSLFPKSSSPSSMKTEIKHTSLKTRHNGAILFEYR